MYISNYFYIFLHISTCRALRLLLPASTNSNKYKAKCSKKVTKSIYTQSVATQKCGAFIEYIIKRHIVAINDTKVWHIPTNSNKYKANCSKYSAKSNNYSAKSNKYSA